jgi:ribosomal protein S19E (S16A)
MVERLSILEFKQSTYTDKVLSILKAHGGRVSSVQLYKAMGGKANRQIIRKTLKEMEDLGVVSVGIIAFGFQVTLTPSGDF